MRCSKVSSRTAVKKVNVRVTLKLSRETTSSPNISFKRTGESCHYLLCALECKFIYPRHKNYYAKLFKFQLNIHLFVCACCHHYQRQRRRWRKARKQKSQAARYEQFGSKKIKLYVCLPFTVSRPFSRLAFAAHTSTKANGDSSRWLTWVVSFDHRDEGGWEVL